MKTAERKKQIIEALTTELADLQKTLEADDEQLSASKQALASAQDLARRSDQGMESIQAASQTGMTRRYASESMQSGPGVDGATVEHNQKLHHAATGLRHSLHQAQERSNRLAPKRTRAQYLARLLGAPELLESAVTAAATTVEMVASASHAVGTGVTALARIDSMLEQAEADFLESRGQAAADLLATVKAGGNTGKIRSANRDQMATFELAKISAEAELISAHAALAAAEKQRDSSIADLRTVRGLVDELNAMVATSAADEAASDARIAALKDLTSDVLGQAKTLLRS